MNNSRRRRIDLLLEQLEDLSEAIEEIKNEEEDAYENLPESIQDSERGEAMYEAVSYLEDAIGYLEGVTEGLTNAKGE